MDQSKREAFARDGAILVEGFLDAEQMATCRAAFDWNIANPGPAAVTVFPGSRSEHHNDNANPRAAERLKALVRSIPFGHLFAELWDSEHVWYFAEEVFLKKGGVAGRTPWHQDTSYLPWGGDHWANAWISFEAVPKANSLEIVRGSHRGILYDGTDFKDPSDPTAPLHGPESMLPRLPDIEAERKADPKAYDILSWAGRPGDMVVLHPGALHGGAPVDAEFPDRHTLVLRFFGDDAVFRSLPAKTKSRYPREGMLFHKELAHLAEGEPFRAPIFEQLR
ncbi:MAG TPA: phytanoyl-CoA dioxygenase family protein [Caulobacteraceae bacterium]|nr:phytanoyl-CoA dioxygenase family protein [Caulobacteraceae bacterium]